MSGHGEKMTRKQEQAIAALLTCRTVEEAARSVGVAEGTLRRWMKDDGFRVEYNAARRLAFDAAIAGLQRASCDAVKLLCDTLTDSDAPAAARVTAARVILDQAAKGIELSDLGERVRLLESRLKAADGKRLRP